MPAAVLCLAAAGCAKEESSSMGADARAYLDVWLAKKHPGVQPNADGLYILSETPGTGDYWDVNRAYNMAEVTIRDMDGVITSTTDRTLAQQLGTYSVQNYYGPIYLAQGTSISFAGVDALMSGMRIGGSRTAVIPSWLLTTNRYDTEAEYLANCDNAAHLIYSVTLTGQTDDPSGVENTQVARYVAEHYPEVTEPSSYTEDEADGSFWFISDTTPFEGQTEFARDTTLYINYTGRRLDGQVFDTTLSRVAKQAGIYDASKTYEPVFIRYASSYEDITMTGSSSLINGFKAALALMKWDLQRCTVVFTSAHGYSYSGSGDAIPSYAPLIFELEIVKYEE